MRIVFLGNALWSVPSLDALVGSSHETVAVITAPARPAGRGQRLTATAVAERAGEIGLPVIEDPGAGLVATLAELEPEALAVVAYGRILPQAALDLPSVAPVNLHFSLLPHLRGASPVQTSLFRGDTETGVTTIRIVMALDAGPVYAQRRVTIEPNEDAGSLGGRLAVIGAGLLVETLDRLADGSATATPQDESAATTCGKITSEDRPISWSDDADAIVRKVRALAPDPGATAQLRGSALQILKAETDDMERDAPAGHVLACDARGIVVAAGHGAVRLLEVAPAGRRRMGAAEFGRGARIAVDERFA